MDGLSRVGLSLEILEERGDERGGALLSSMGTGVWAKCEVSLYYGILYVVQVPHELLVLRSRVGDAYLPVFVFVPVL